MKRTMIIMASILVICGFALTSSVYAASKVGYINVQKIVSESNIGKIAKKDVDKLKEEKEAELKKSAQAINDLKTLIEKGKDSMKADDLRDRAAKLQDMVKEHKRLVSDVKEEIQRKDRELVVMILQKADAVLKKVAKKGKFTMIIKDPNAVGYLDPEIDITDEVIQELNKK